MENNIENNTSQGSPKELDKLIEEKEEKFKGVINSILNGMFRVETECRRIYVDLNSCLSVVFHQRNVNDEDIESFIMDQMEKFMTRYLNLGATITILFTLEPSKYHTAIFPDWCRERYENVKIRRSEVIKRLLVGFSEFSAKNPSIKVVNVKEIHPLAIVKYLEEGKRSQCCVLSKDPVFQCANLNMSIWTGVNYIDLQDSNRILPDEVELDDPTSALPIYLTIRGDDRNEYPGIPGIGKVKSLRYIASYALEMNSNMDHPNKEYITKYIKLYDDKSLFEYFPRERYKEIVG